MASILAAATVSVIGYVTQVGFTGTVGHVAGSGVWVLTLANPPPNLTSDLVITALLIGTTPGMITRSALINPNQIQISTFDAAGVAADLPFHVLVADLAP